jgi:hypothetical protein
MNLSTVVIGLGMGGLNYKLNFPAIGKVWSWLNHFLSGLSFLNCKMGRLARWLLKSLPHFVDLCLSERVSGHVFWGWKKTGTALHSENITESPRHTLHLAAWVGMSPYVCRDTNFMSDSACEVSRYMSTQWAQLGSPNLHVRPQG